MLPVSSPFALADNTQCPTPQYRSLAHPPTHADHLMLSSLRQISDVALVHDERVLMVPICDDTVGYYRLVGADVVTDDSQFLGKVRCANTWLDGGAAGQQRWWWPW